MSSFYSEEELKRLGFKSIGTNVLISKNACFYGIEKMAIGSNVRIDDFCLCSGNVEIGNYVHIAAGTMLFGGDEGIILSDFSGLSSRCVVYASSDDYSGNSLTNPTVPNEYRNVTGGKVTLGKHSIVGSGCTILPNVTIGEGTSIGSMSLVNKNLDEWSIYVGIPCKKIKNREKRCLELEKQLVSYK